MGPTEEQPEVNESETVARSKRNDRSFRYASKPVPFRSRDSEHRVEVSLKSLFDYL
jgi:hypothetical protein